MSKKSKLHLQLLTEAVCHRTAWLEVLHDAVLSSGWYGGGKPLTEEERVGQAKVLKNTTFEINELEKALAEVTEFYENQGRRSLIGRTRSG